MPRDSAQSSTPPTSAPDCDRKASLPGFGFAMPKLALTPSAGTQMPQAVRSDDAEAGRPRRVEHPLAEVRAKSGGDDDGSARALLAKCRDQAWNRVWRRGDDGEVRRLGQIVDALEGVVSVDPPVLGIDEIDRSRKAARQHIPGELSAHRVAVSACPDHRDRAWTQGIFEIADGHWRFELAIEAAGFQ